MADKIEIQWENGVTVSQRIKVKSLEEAQDTANMWVAAYPYPGSLHIVTYVNDEPVRDQWGTEVSEF